MKWRRSGPLHLSRWLKRIVEQRLICCHSNATARLKSHSSRFKRRPSRAKSRALHELVEAPTGHGRILAKRDADEQLAQRWAASSKDRPLLDSIANGGGWEVCD